ncbi:putative cell agglutination protein SPAPB2C8.01 [Fusarium oxysporum f. sp. albedinis]|nr:putative cell agglutination protein SPAPB2C8.01 [Fusarium oxysporum f. sp. albedinis]
MPSVLPTQVRHLSRCRYRRPTASLLHMVEAPTSRWIMATKPPPLDVSSNQGKSSLGASVTRHPLIKPHVGQCCAVGTS